jgi:hypothetical protein
MFSVSPRRSSTTIYEHCISKISCIATEKFLFSLLRGINLERFDFVILQLHHWFRQVIPKSFERFGEESF